MKRWQPVTGYLLCIFIKELNNKSKLNRLLMIIRRTRVGKPKHESDFKRTTKNWNEDEKPAIRYSKGTVKFESLLRRKSK